MSTKPVFRTKGIILHSIDFQEHDRILSVFSRDDGIVSIIVNGANRPSKGKPLTAPLTYAEFVYTKTRGELLRCCEVTPLETHLKLRDSLVLLETACTLLQALAKSQMPGKASPLLFDLLHAYLHELPKVADPHVLAASFKLKLLRHDGFLHLEDRCTACGEAALPLYIAYGECFCSLHAPAYGRKFDEEEVLIMKILLMSRRFEFLSTLELPLELKEKLDGIFTDQLQR